MSTAHTVTLYTSNAHPTVGLVLELEAGRQVCVPLPLGAGDVADDAGGSVARETTDAVARLAKSLLNGREVGPLAAFDAEVAAKTAALGSPDVRARVAFLLSAAHARAAAITRDLPLATVLAEAAGRASGPSCPVPWVSAISGGAVALGELGIRSVIVVPSGIGDVRERTRAAAEICHEVGALLKASGATYAGSDDGGHSVELRAKRAEDALRTVLDWVTTAVRRTGYGEQVGLAVHAGADAVRTGDRYALLRGAEPLAAADVAELWSRLADTYPIRFLVDPVAPDHGEALAALRARVGPDVVLAWGGHGALPAGGSYGAALLRPDTAGTLTELCAQTARLAAAGVQAVAAARTGDTEDALLADLAAGAGASYLWAGGIFRSERTAKHNQLVRLAEPGRRNAAAPAAGTDRFRIVHVHAREILDSRGRPTVEAEVHLAGGAAGRAAVPSGASTGSQEALELRDGDATRFRGAGVLRAVGHVNGEIAAALAGQDARDQAALDAAMLALDGSEGRRKVRLGANAILAASLATAHAAAGAQALPLYRYIRAHLYPTPADAPYLLPVPMLNFINGGAHAQNSLDFQEFMLVPHGASSMEEAVAWGADVYRVIRRAMLAGAGVLRSYGVGDEGGFSMSTPAGLSPRDTVRAVLDALGGFVEEAGYRFARDGHFGIALDPAASEFHRDGAYVLGGRRGGTPQATSSADMVRLYAELVADYPILSIEDGMGERDADGWASLTREIGDRCQLVGDDLFVTHPDIFRAGIESGLANAILVKVNQIGSLSESLDVVRMAHEHGYAAVISHRSGETEDATIADIAVAVNAGQIKTGCVSRADRTAKYNRLLMISRDLGSAAEYAGRAAHARATRSR
jgi:enolase